MRRDEAPSTARRCAQLRQIIRLGSCPHPEHALVLRMTTDDGYVEYCSDCNHVTDSYFPSPIVLKPRLDKPAN